MMKSVKFKNQMKLKSEADKFRSSYRVRIRYEAIDAGAI